MPEVPQEAAPSREEQLLSQEANPDTEVMQQPVPTPDAPEAPVAPYEAVESDKVKSESYYEQGSVYNFTDPSGQGYSIVIQEVAEDKLTILNQTAPGSEPAELPLDQAFAFFAAGKLVQ